MFHADDPDVEYFCRHCPHCIAARDKEIREEKAAREAKVYTYQRKVYTEDPDKKPEDENRSQEIDGEAMEQVQREGEAEYALKRQAEETELRAKMTLLIAKVVVLIGEIRAQRKNRHKPARTAKRKTKKRSRK